MVQSTRKETKRTEEQMSIASQTVWLIVQVSIMKQQINDLLKMKQQMSCQHEATSNKMSCQHEAIARNGDACRTPPRQTGTGRAPRERTPKTTPTPPTIPPTPTSPPLEPLMPLSSLVPRPTPAVVSPLPSLSPLSPLLATELIDLLGSDFDIDLEVERKRYQKP